MRVGELEEHQFTEAFFHEAAMLAALLVEGEAEPLAGRWMKVISPSAEGGSSKFSQRRFSPLRQPHDDIAVALAGTAHGREPVDDGPIERDKAPRPRLKTVAKALEVRLE
jgi:hypothetical protein